MEVVHKSYFYSVQNYQNNIARRLCLIYVIAALSCLFISGVHPFYLSVTELKYNLQSKKMEVSVKLFTDDFENVLNKIHHKPFNLTNPTDEHDAEKKVEGYILEQLRIQCDQKNLALHFIGYEQEDNAIWSYFESGELSQPKRVDIHNNLFNQFIKEQINIMHVQIGSARKSYKLDNPQTRAAFEF